MADFIILHGTKGSPEGNWFAWLDARLTAKGHDVFRPPLPTPENQSLANWQAAFATQAPLLTATTTIIGHSCGATFLLHILEKAPTPIAQSIFISPVTDIINIPEYDALNKSFIDHDFDWQKIRSHMGDGFILHGDNDPYVPLTQPQRLAENLGLALTLIPKGGHLNSESGYDEFPELLAMIKS